MFSDHSPASSGVLSGPQISYLPTHVKPIIDLFSSLFNVPEDMLAPVREAMEKGRMDFTRLPMNEVPSFLFPYDESEVATLLFLLGKPFFLMRRKHANPGNFFWNKGRCPICHGASSLASTLCNGERFLHCPYCSFRGTWERTGCPHCQNQNAIALIDASNELGFRLAVCSACRGYLKIWDQGFGGRLDPDILDLISLPLDILAQGKGFHRPCPNPLGMRVMV